MKAKRHRPVSRSSYAAERGVSRQAVDQAVARGLIIPLPGGRIDERQADAIWFRRHQQRADARQDGAEQEAARERANLTKTVAEVQMTRRKVERLRARLVDRDAEQRQIGAIVRELRQELLAMRADPDPIMRAAIEMVISDLGDLQAEALAVTRRD